MKNDDLVNRINYLMSYYELNNVEFANRIGVLQPNISAMMAGKRSIGDGIINKILLSFDINREWLTKGSGEMLKGIDAKDGYSEPIHEAVIINPNIIEVPFISQYAYAGYLAGYSDIEYLKVLPKIPFFVNDENPKGNYVCLEVKGDSMYNETEDSIMEGDKLLCREIRSDLWRCKLHYRKWDFVIVHQTDGILVKRIIDHNTEKGEITIHSLNGEYEDRVMCLNDIAKLFNIIEISRPRRR